ncbi:hypothetical protein [Alteribacter populi]|uniref:hypothetical protein n=1 Tax=Alteribacter populi TaxID=2011011 RepID=UPI000BBA58A1|nr:hypothetical protein [Alteribacter populi]
MKKEDICFIEVESSLYVNKDIRIKKLFPMLLKYAKPFTLFERKTRSNIVNALPRFILRVIRIIQFTFLFYKQRNRLKNNNLIPSIYSSCKGICLLKLRQGEYKVFNFKEKKVTTIFPQKLDCQKVNDRVDSILESNLCPLSPEVLHFSKRKRMLVEDYVNSGRPEFTKGEVTKYNSLTFPILISIMNSTQPRVIYLEEYKSHILQTIKSYLSENTNDNNQKHNALIKNFVFDTEKRLRTYSDNTRIIEVFSHGDFWEGNILIDKKEFKVIDWTTTNFRSCFFDFFFSFFMFALTSHNYSNRNNQIIIFLKRNIENSFKKFSEELSKNSPLESQSFIVSSNLYRNLFYLEVLALKLNTNLQEKPITECVLWIKRFKNFEKHTSTKDTTLKRRSVFS